MDYCVHKCVGFVWCYGTSIKDITNSRSCTGYVEQWSGDPNKSQPHGWELGGYKNIRAYINRCELMLQNRLIVSGTTSCHCRDHCLSSCGGDGG